MAKERKCDIVGLTVKLTKEIRSGKYCVPVNTRAIVTGHVGSVHSSGYSIELEPCGHCGVQVRMSGLKRDRLRVENTVRNMEVGQKNVAMTRREIMSPWIRWTSAIGAAK